MIAFTGLSHLGLVSAAATASRGFQVLAFDPDPVVVTSIEPESLPVFEPGLGDLLNANRSRIAFSADAETLRRAEVVVIALDVATDDRGHSDLSALRALIDTVLPNVRPGASIAVLSQVPPGFTRALAARLEHVPVYYQVETLVFGQAVDRALKPERYIVGCHEPGQPLAAPYADLLEAGGCPILPMRYESAELAKISINAFLAASVSTANTLAALCERLGGDWSEIAPSLRLDARIGPHAYLAPGLGIGGGNLPRDLATIRALAAEYGVDATVIDSFLANSEYQANWVLRHLHATVLEVVPDPVVAIWGLAYKPGTASTRNSQGMKLLDTLRGLRVQVHDPQVSLAPMEGVTRASSPLEAAEEADVLVVMTAWDEFKAIELDRLAETLSGNLVIDPFGTLDADRSVAAGLRRLTIGTATSGAGGRS